MPASQLTSVASRWQALDSYVTTQAYVVPFGYLSSPEFVSNRVDMSALIFTPLEGPDFSSITLK